MTVIHNEVLILAALYLVMSAFRVNPGRLALLLGSIFLLGVGYLSILA